MEIFIEDDKITSKEFINASKTILENENKFKKKITERIQNFATRLKNPKKKLVKIN